MQISMDDTIEFYNAWDAVQAAVYATAREKGWWDKLRSDGECIALMHSELSEALEFLRNPPAHGEQVTTKNLRHENNKKVKGVEEELADVVIRIMDYAEHNGFDIAGAIIAKAEYNESRPHRHGGKAF